MRRVLLCEDAGRMRSCSSKIRRSWHLARYRIVGGILLFALATTARTASGAELAELHYIREIWLDEARQRHVNVRIARPPSGVAGADSPRRPVLLFSTPQGFRWGGHVDHYTELAEELWRRGIVMVTVSHYDRAEPLEGGERFSDVYPGILTGSRNDAAIDRFEDGLFVLDELARIDTEAREGWPRLDLERLAVGGHSAGTLTALHLAGMPVRDREGEELSAQRTPRVQAFVLYGYPLEYSGPSRDDLKRVDAVAGLHVTGSRDHPEYRQTSYRYVGGASQYWLVVEGDHNVGAFGSEDLVLKVTGDFFDAFLRDDAEARSRLRRSALRPYGGALVELGIRSPSWRPRLDQRDFVAWAREFLPWGEWLHDRAIASTRARETRAR